MRSLVIFYSRTDKTRFVSKTLAKALKSDLRELIDKDKRKGIFGFIKSGFDALMAKRADLLDPEFNIKGYDLVMIGTPVWASRPAPAMLTLFDNIDLKKKKVVIFCTAGSDNAQETLNIMSGYVKNSGGDLVYMFYIKTGRVHESSIVKAAKDFASQIRGIR